MLERDIVGKVMGYLKTVPGCFAWKQHGGQYGQAGLPDIIACINGRFVALEVKTPTGRLTKIQETTLQRIQRAKGAAYKVTSVDEVKKIIENLNTWTEGLPDGDNI
jgi:Holliday junction resolvase